MERYELELEKTAHEECVSILTDKLHREKYERKKLQELVRGLPVGLAVLKGGNGLYFEEVNEAFLREEGYTRADLLTGNRPFTDYICKEDIGGFEDMMENCREGKTTEHMELRFVGSDGNLHWFMVQTRLYAYRNATPYYLLTAWNIDERKALENKRKRVSKKRNRQLAEELRLDPLTRLLNKVAIAEAITQAIAEEPDATHVMFLIDIDNFKQVNDTFGHTVGDTVILDAAQAIAEQFDKKSLVGRIGGDEFLAFMKHTTVEKAKACAEKLCGENTKQLIGGDAVVNVTLSVGLAVYGVDAFDYKTLFEMADRAMYQIKRGGKNGFHFVKKGEEQPMPSAERRSMREEEWQVRSGDMDKEFLHFAFSLLSHARDINGSLNVLIEQIGKKYHVDFAAVFENMDEKSEVMLTNCWSNYGQVYEKPVFMPYIHEFEEAGVGEFVMIEEMPGEERILLSNWNKTRQRIRRLAALKFEFSGSRIGWLCVGWHHRERKITASERETFRELGRIVGVFATLRRKLSEDQREIRQLQELDMLTGLYNPDAFRKNVQKHLAVMQEKTPDMVYGLVHIDINNFSYVNENFGSEVGDHILQELAEQIRGADYVLEGCHLYSDFFVELICGRSEAELYHRVLEENSRFADRQKEKYPASAMSLSAGICFVTGPRESFETVLEGANLARKQAKEQKNISVAVYREDMRRKRDATIQITGRFYAAMQKGEIEIFLQPKFLLDKGQIYGAEALARWRNAAGEVVSPSEFIPSLENIGYIVDLDFYILEQLLRAMRRWKNAGRQLFTVSTNFSRRHFEDGGENFVKRLRELMERYGIEPQYIEIEVTESVIVDNLDSLKNCLAELVREGYRIAIDDFGTGYSSLSVLMEVPADVIKIDKQFTERISVAEQREFVTQMGQFIRAAKSEIIFEGIEEEQQQRFLLDCGFRYGQGYLFDKPLPVEEFERKYI